MDGPPPPPPHGSNPKSTGGPGSGGLPAGNYDIFIIPPHSSGGGFVYLPSLQVQRNSFIAGVASTLASIAVWMMIEPTIKQWFVMVTQSVSSGGNGVVLLVAVVGVAGWAWGKTQGDGGGFGGAFGGGSAGGAGAGASGANYQRAPPPPPPHNGYPGAGSPPPQGANGGWHGAHQQRGTAPPPPQENDSWSGSDPDARANWEKAREETRKNEEEQKKKEEERKAKEEADRQARAKAEKEKWEKMRAREREQRERDARERIARERAQKEKDAKDKEERERQAREATAREKIEREIRDKLEAEQRAKAVEEAARKAAEDKAAKEAAAVKAKADAERAERLKAARERAQRDREARLKAEADKIKAETAASAPTDAGRRSTTYGGMGGGERLDPFAGSRSPPAGSVSSSRTSPIKATVTPKKNYEKPSAKSYIGTEDEHSFRPYDTPSGARRPPKPPSHGSSAYTASSYAASQSTARTSPPASQRGPYSTNDPDKIQIKAVYLFNDLFPKPVAQLVSNVGKVTDGLILKIQSEGLFIDDDVRNIPQREWDVKAWTLKLVEVSGLSAHISSAR